MLLPIGKTHGKSPRKWCFGAGPVMSRALLAMLPELGQLSGLSPFITGTSLTIDGGAHRAIA